MLKLKLHILLFLCLGRLLPFLLLLPDTLLPAFQALHYGWLFPGSAVWRYCSGGST